MTDDASTGATVTASMAAWPARLKVLSGKPPGTLMVHEIYSSIQGESTYAGLPCTFVRLTGCQLRCSWCDTPYAFHEGSVMTHEQILERVTNLSPRLVELTGGEPLAQPEAFLLITALADRGFKVLVETGGAVAIDAVDPRAVVILDVKCPGSGETAANRWENLHRLRPADEVKFVLADRTDFEFAVDIVRKYRLQNRQVLFSPVFGVLEYATLCQWILESGLAVRFQLQQHKHVWHPAARGV